MAWSLTIGAGRNGHKQLANRSLPWSNAANSGWMGCSDSARMSVLSRTARHRRCFAKPIAGSGIFFSCFLSACQTRDHQRKLTTSALLGKIQGTTHDGHCQKKLTGHSCFGVLVTQVTLMSLWWKGRRCLLESPALAKKGHLVCLHLMAIATLVSKWPCVCGVWCHTFVPHPQCNQELIPISSGL